jgi:hypothetical protein
MKAGTGEHAYNRKAGNGEINRGNLRGHYHPP